MAFVKVERLDGFSHESNDCTVRALASACGLSYADAHLIAKEMGREVGKGFWMEKLFTSQKLSGFKFDRRKFINLNRRPMIVDVMKQQGTYIVRLVDRHQVLSHVFTIVNGVIYDDRPPKSQLLYIESFWKVETN